jgi:NAD(P)-dependent dehydrogenase (short-subunit alcohol dehydrogenase family)
LIIKIQRANAAATKIIELTQNKNVEVERLDLADLGSVREFSELINSKLNRLDLLINNAGIMMCPYWKTKDGFEMQFGTNHLGKFVVIQCPRSLLILTDIND